MWNANIKSNSMDTLGRIVVNVVYSNGTQDISESYTFSTSDNISNKINDRLNELQGVDDYLANPLIGDYTPPTPPAPQPVIIVTPPDPTPEELAKKKFIDDWNTLKQMKRAVAYGLKADTDTDVVAQVKLVASELIPDYFPLL